jgi:hypothetical protein
MTGAAYGASDACGVFLPCLLCKRYSVLVSCDGSMGIDLPCSLQLGSFALMALRRFGSRSLSAGRPPLAGISSTRSAGESMIDEIGRGKFSFSKPRVAILNCLSKACRSKSLDDSVIEGF